MRLFPASLRWRTLLVIVGALVLSQATAMWLLDRYVTQPRLALNIGQFVSHLKTIGAALQTMTAAQQEQFVARIAEKDGIRIVPVRGNERMRPAPDRPPLAMFRERLRGVFGPATEVYMRGPEAREMGRDGRPRVLWVKLPAGERDFWVAIPRGRLERDTATAIVTWGVVGLLIAILATFFLVSRLNRPLGELARAAAQLGGGGDPPPVSETGPSEIREVARAFNQMKQDLRRNERERATFLAGVSHDLRTPLARMRLDVEMLQGKVDPEVQRGMVSDLADMNAIIDQFIDFTRTEAAEPLSGLDLSELARGCAERAARSGVQVTCELAELPLMMLRPLAMQRMVDNLLVNAGRHAGGPVLLRTAREGASVVVSVLDRGPGIPADRVELVKQPFTRADEARSGSSGAGLGLAIVNRVATLHGGRLELLPREGGGLEARVTLPASNGAGATRSTG
ncbi:MAG TPA: ATP-binding protein [Usitatibacter sp.]|nr:ATP-binding protein [Usitatibacter sp.]